MKPKIIAFSGSTRKGSYNKKVVKNAVLFLEESGAEVTLIDLKEYLLPIYDGDLEKDSGIPAKAVKLKKLFKEHNGLFISTPEYNGYFSGVLKNTIDWISRPMEGEKKFEPFLNKVAAITAASPGKFGGIRVLPHLRQLLTNLKVLVIPEQIGFAKASNLFDKEDKFIENENAKRLRSICRKLVRTIINDINSIKSID